MVGSGTMNARAISAVFNPPTARSVRAICDMGVSEGWQHRKNKVSVSSVAGADPGTASAKEAVVSSRRRRAESLLHDSIKRLEATVANHAFGFSGMPSAGHCLAAASKAS
jgi:hypothetical protein